MNQDFGFEEVRDLFASSPQLNVAEAHGILAGMLSSDRKASYRRWLDAVFAGDAETCTGDQEAVLKALFEDAKRSLADSDYTFQLLLPDDDVPLCERAEALGCWCQGFLYGIGYFSGDRDWSADSAEVLRDLVEISQLDSDVSGEANEVAFAELTEFVRMGVYLLCTEFKKDKPTLLH